MIKQKTAMQMQESATLKAGQGSANRTWRLKYKKSMTCWCTKRSVRLPRIPAKSRKGYKEDVIIGKGPKGRARVSDINQPEEVWQDDMRRLEGIDETKDKILRGLVEHVKRQSKEEKDSHLSVATTSAQRSQRSG